MSFEEFLPEEEEVKEVIVDKEIIVEKIGQSQVYDLITSKKPDWQSIIYDLIHSEQLDPWDVNIVILTSSYFEKIEELDDFYISSKVLLAAALLLRIKSEFLLNRHIRSIDEILFGKKDEEKKVIEKIEIDNEDLPILIPKTPMARNRRITLNELMEALGKAINTESRRIKREVAIKRAKHLSELSIPDIKRTDLNDRIKQFYARILTSIKRKATKPEKHLNKVTYTDLIGTSKEEKLSSFLPLLHLSNSKKLWLEQEKHLDEILIYLYKYFDGNRDKFKEELENDLEEIEKDIEELEKLEVIADATESFEEETPLQKARRKQEEKKQMQADVMKELSDELGLELGE